MRLPFIALLLCPLPAAGEQLAEGWLGVYLADSESEARVAEVIPGSPAEAAGLKPGDVVLEVDGKATGTVEAFAEAFEGYDAGARVRLRLRRGEDELEVEVVLVERPGAVSQVPGFLGVAVVPADRGVMVSEVLVDSPAAAGGIAPGDRIVRLHGEPVRSVSDVERVMKALTPGTEIAVNVQNDRGSASLLIRLGARPLETGSAGVAAGPGAAPGPGGPAEPRDSDLEARLERAEREVARLGRELQAMIELRGEMDELRRLREELGQLREALRELLRNR